jgi:hypothetical protein
MLRAPGGRVSKHAGTELQPSRSILDQPLRFPPYGAHIFFREADELVEGFAPTVVEARGRMLFGARFIAVDHDCGVLYARAVRFEQDDRGKERHVSGHVLRAVAMARA